MLEATKEARSTCIQILRFSEIEAAPLNEIISFPEQVNTLLDVVNEIHIPIIVAPVHQWQLQGRAGVTAIEDHEKAAVWCKISDHVLMQHVAVNLSIALEVNGTNGI
jgi:hypothetical protein